MRISDWSSDVCSSVLDEQQQGYDHARPDHCALYPGIALRFLVVVHFHSLYRRSQDRSARANNNICSAVRESLSKFAAEGPPVSPSRSHRPAITRSEEHTSELQSLMRISYAVFCLKKKHTKQINNNTSSQENNTMK